MVEDGGGDDRADGDGEAADIEPVEAAAAAAIADLDAEDRSVERAAAAAVDASEAPAAAPSVEEAAASAIEAAEEAPSPAPRRRPSERSRSPLRRERKEPPDDVEMPLTEHIEEMLSRLAIVAVIGGIVTVLAFPFATDIVTTMWYDIHPGTRVECVPNPRLDGCVPPHVYSPLDLILTQIRVAAIAGIVVALPVLVYQTYAFMRPGLYPHERKYYLAAVPTSLVLALIGMAFAYFVVLPILFTFFLFYSEGSAELAFALVDTFSIMLTLLTVLAIVFQIPLFIMLAIMMGVTTREWLEQRRLIFWIAFAGIAFVFSPDPTGMAPFLVGLTMVALFEGTLLLLRWTGR